MDAPETLPSQKEKDALSAEQLAKLQTDNIIQTGSVITKGPEASIFCLSVIGQIEGHYLLPPNSKATKYEHVIPMLAAIEENEHIDGLLVLLNTMGGDVEAGLAIAEMISSMKKPSVSLVLGGSHSIGVPLAVATKHSFIVPSATMTLHPVRMNGTIINVPQSFTYLSKMQERILSFITANSNADIGVLKSLMNKTDEIAADIGSVINGFEAVRVGLIDGTGGLSEAFDHLKMQIRNVRRHAADTKSDYDVKSPENPVS